MRKRALIGWLIAVFLAMPAIAIAQSYQPPAPGGKHNRPPQLQPQTTQQPTCTDQRGTEQSPTFIKIIPTPKTEGETGQDTRDHAQKATTDWLLMVFTGAVALFTFVLGCIGLWQGFQLRNAVQATRNEFVSTHRPKLIVREAYTPLPPPPEGAWITVFVTVANVGETEAKIVESSIGFDLVTEQRYTRTPRAEGRNDLDIPGPIHPGESREFKVTSVKHSWNAQTLAIYDDPGHGLFLVGHIAYIDKIGIRRQLAYWRRYEPTHQRFVRIYNVENEYEYSD